MVYKTVVTDYAPKANKMADEIEKTINEKAKEGWEPVTFSVTNSCKAIILFCVPDNTEKWAVRNLMIRKRENRLWSLGKIRTTKKTGILPPAALFNFSVGSAAGALKYKKKKEREISDEEKKNDEK